MRRLPWLPALLLLVAGCASAPRETQRAEPPGEAMVLPEHYSHSIAALGMPGARRAFQVGSGSVVGSGDAAIEWRLLSQPGASKISPVYFERDGVPVAHWWMVSPQESVHFEAAAVPCAALGDTSLLLSVRATVTGRSDVPRECVLEMRVRTRAEGPTVTPWDAEDTDSHEEQWRGHFAIRNQRLVAGVDPSLTVTPAGRGAWPSAPTRGPGPGVLVATGRIVLARGAQHHWDFWMPVYPTSAAGAGLDRLAHHERVVAEARATWREWLSRSAPLATPDSLLNAAWRAALVTLIVSQEREGEEWVPLGNPFQYRDVWLRDAARSVRALAVAGLTDLARADAWTLRRFQLPSGVLLSQWGQLDGTGQALWAFTQAASLPPDRDFAERTLPHARRALAWLDLQRALTRQLQIRYAGLIPYGDPRDNELTRAQLVGNDAWGIAGYRSVVTLATLAGDDALARAADTSAVAYRADFLAALKRSGSRDVPPSWQGPGREWGNLAVGYPTRVLPADDPRLSALAQRVRARSGGPGLVICGPADTLHTYLGTDLAQWSLLAGRPGEARAYLADLLAHSSSTLGQAEVISRQGGSFGLVNLPPHATAAAGLVDLVRNMIVSDTRDTLELALGADPSWWRGTRFDRAPTRFGVIDLALETPAPDHRRARWSPVAVPVRVRVADGERLLEVLTPGARAVGGSWVECPPRSREVEFRVANANPRGTGR